MMRAPVSMLLLLVCACGASPQRPPAGGGADCTTAAPVDGHCPAGCEVVAGECAKSKGLCTPNDPVCNTRTGS